MKWSGSAMLATGSDNSSDSRSNVKRGINFTKIWSDEDMIELRIEVSDGASLFCNHVYVGYSDFSDAVSRLDTFKDHIHGGLLDMRFGEFGPEYASGAFHARFHFPKPGKLYVTCKQQSGFQDFGRKNVASEATLYLRTEPVLLDNFLEPLRFLDAKKREDAYLDTTTTGRVLAAIPRSANQTSPGRGLIEDVHHFLLDAPRAADVQSVVVRLFDDFSHKRPNLLRGFRLPLVELVL
jgi:hypothetical protein